MHFGLITIFGKAIHKPITMRSFLIFILSFSLLLSCTSNSSSSNSSQIDIESAKIVTPIVFKTEKALSEIYDIRIMDSVLVLRSDDGKGCLHIFNKYNFKYIKTNGIIGKGPGELRNSMVEIKIIDDSLYLFELSKNSISLYHKNSFINDSSPEPDKSTVFQQYRGNFDIFPVDTFYISRPTVKTRFALFNKSGELINSYNEYPDLGTKVEKSVIEMAFRNYSLTEPKPDRSKFVSLSFVGGVLEIFQIQGGKIDKLKQKIFLFPNFNNTQEIISLISNETNIGFYNVYTTNEYIYASYSGLTNKEFKENSFLLDYITVFDWEGNLKKLYKVEGGVLDIAADESQNKIYIVTKNNEGEECVGYINM